MDKGNLRPPAASKYLRKRYGLRRTTKTLAKDRVNGTGPRFRKCGRDVIYEIPELDAFANARISPESYRSTAEVPVEQGPQKTSTASGESRTVEFGSP